LDVHESTISVAVAESGRNGEVRQVGVIENRVEILLKLAKRLSEGGRANPDAELLSGVGGVPLARPVRRIVLRG
jgi:hypothetical protein